MMLKLYTVKDKLADFSGPIAFKDEKMAERWFEAFCKSKKQQEFTDAKYFELYEIGHFDADNGTITGYPKTEIQLIREGESYDE